MVSNLIAEPPHLNYQHYYSLRMWFHWFNKEGAKKSGRSAPYTRIGGADWFIEGDRSYEIVAQNCVPGTEIICIQTLLKPRDWVGQAYLETTEGSMKILKEDGQGVWFWRDGWMGVHWLAETVEWPIVERWLKN